MIKRGIYCHFKGMHYFVEGFARHSETNENLVVYRPLYGDYQLTVRPLEMFMETVKNPSNDLELIPRFTLITEVQPMKLLFCPTCRDAFCLAVKSWRKCFCGSAQGQYNSDALTATIWGKTVKIFGVANPFFDPDFESWSPRKLAAVRKKWGYAHAKKEIWWGGHPGDWQLLRSSKPKALSDRMVNKKVREIAAANGATEERIQEILAQLRERRKQFAHLFKPKTEQSHAGK